MRRWMLRALLIGCAGIALGSSSCAGNYTVGYGYTGSDPYGEVFYQQPIDRYSFYGHP